MTGLNRELVLTDLILRIEHYLQRAPCCLFLIFERDIMFLVDSHCHLDGLDYQSLHKDVDDVLAKAAARCEVLFSGGDDAAGVSPYAQAGRQAR